MIKLSVGRYSLYLGLQLVFLFVDLVANSYSFVLNDNRRVVSILLFLTQDICLVLSLAILFFGLYSTYMYQAGLFELLTDKFRAPFVTLIVYLVLCVSHHVWIVQDYQTDATRTTKWAPGLTALWFVQRLLAPFYYYLVKRSALRLSDPRFHNNLDWINERLAIN